MMKENKSLTIKELTEYVAANNGISKAAAGRIVLSVIDCMTFNLSTLNREVNLETFGRFKVKTRQARKGRNPKTGEQIEIPETKVVTFKASPSLKKEVANV